MRPRRYGRRARRESSVLPDGPGHFAARGGSPADPGLRRRGDRHCCARRAPRHFDSGGPQVARGAPMTRLAALQHPARTIEGGYDVERIRADFPALAMQVYGKPLVYLDNAASAQKPRAVLDRLELAYTRES